MASYTIMMDSSAISCLYEGGSSDEIVRGLQAAGDVRISAISVLEAIADGDEARRTALLELQKQMTRGTRPYDIPGALVKKSIVAYSAAEKSIDITVSEDHVAAWEVIEEPASIEAGVAEIARQENKKEEDRFYGLHRDMREDLDRVFGSGVKKPASAIEYMRALLGSAEMLHARIAPIYGKVVGRELQVSEAAGLFSGSPLITAYFLALAYADYKRSIADTHYGRKNAGLRDLSFAAYLPHISVFVTNDHEQEVALSTVEEIVNTGCEVVGYSGWSRRILL